MPTDGYDELRRSPGDKLLNELLDKLELPPFFGTDGENTASRKNGAATKRAKGYAPWKPQKKTRIILAQVNEILREYRDYLPLTGRQIFYRLVGAYNFEKTEKAYERLTNYLVRARRAELIPFKYIRDDGASVMTHRHYRDENAFWAFVNELARNFQRNKLANQKVDIRVYCEAAGMMPQLHDVCRPYSVPVYSCSGFDSLTAKYDLARSCFKTFTYEGRKTVILHLGDYDPSGDSIFNDGLVEDIYGFLSRDVPYTPSEKVAHFERVAMRPEHIDDYDLDTAPPKQSDSRTARWSGTETCQLEALPPDILAELLTDAIHRHIDEAIYDEDCRAEVGDKQRITKSIPAPSE